MIKMRHVLAQIRINKVYEVLVQNTRENLMWTRTKTRLGEAQITKNKENVELAQNHNKKTWVLHCLTKQNIYRSLLAPQKPFTKA